MGKRFVLGLTSRDVMTRDVVCLSEEMPMREAARLLLRNRISGAPVVDSLGRCTGVISNTDFLNFAENHGQMVSRPASSAVRAGRTGAKRDIVPGRIGCVCTDWEVLDVEEFPLDAVRHFMTHDPVTVAAETPIQEVARKMIDAQIHRVIVVDHERKPIGIVTSTDLLAALAYSDEGPN
jgi:CBS domain-containing protein